MIVSEAEAKSKWCPEVRVHSANHGAGINAFAALATDGMAYEITRMGNCIGSECMMWEWGANETGVHSPKKGYCGKRAVAR